MKLKLIKFDKLTENKDIFEKALDKTKTEYRPFDPGQYLYNLLLEKRNKIDLFCDEYLELVYTTLISWNMNGRGAKLNDLELFKESIRKNKSEIESLKKYKIEELTNETKEKMLEIVGILFAKLDLVGKSWTKKKIKSKLVTFSKTMHFLLPKLIVPIDRRYTLEFFYSNREVPIDQNITENNKKQMKVFCELYNQFCEITKIYNLEKYRDSRWNVNIPKIIDNAIIGYDKI